MEKQVIVFDTSIPKKHSVCFKTSQADAAITTVYVMRTGLGKPIPTKIKVTVEEVTT